MKEYQLPKKFATKWIRALRTTPEEKHITGKYCNYDGFCSIGLGLMANGVKVSHPNETDNITLENQLLFYNYGINGKQKCFFDIIWHLNDINRMSFIQIAYWITENVEFI